MSLTARRPPDYSGVEVEAAATAARPRRPQWGLRERLIAGAGLDVTPIEPLPDGHPLWDLPNAIITPHTANWPEITGQLLAGRITANVARFAAGQPLEGRVDPGVGY